MKRYSALWWLAVVPTSVFVGIPMFLLLGQQTEWGVWERVLAALVCTAIVELAVVALIQRAAPTDVVVGPGERHTADDVAGEDAVVLSGFGDSSSGRVAVRGETWSAVRSADDKSHIIVGSVVSVVDRVGLSLVVAVKRS